MMKIAENFSLDFLGQAGFKIRYNDIAIYIDPYLSHSVEKLEGNHQNRLTPIMLDPESIIDAHLVLITHEHLDHCDPETLCPIYQNNPGCIFVGPQPVIEILNVNGFNADRTLVCSGNGELIGFFDWINIFSVPAAHPNLEYDSKHNSRFVGYVIDWEEITLYHSGDTSLCKELIELMIGFSPIDIALLPVNECNYYKFRENIIGNLTIREAFRFCEDIGAEILIPTHWDMFDNNKVYPEEIELLYKLIKPKFSLQLFDPTNSLMDN